MDLGRGAGRAGRRDDAHRLPMCRARATPASARHDEPLFPTEVMFHQQPVAWVLGETLEAARLGAARVAVEYEPLPAILTHRRGHRGRRAFSPVPRVMASRRCCAAIESQRAAFSGELAHRRAGAFLPGDAVLRSRGWMRAAAVALHSSTQHPAETQEIVARVLGLPRNQVTVECLRMGGAFGGKEVQAAPYAAVAALGRVEDEAARARAADARARHGAHRQTPSVPGAVRRRASTTDGRLEGVRIALYSDGGWSLDLSEPILWRALFHMRQRVPACRRRN